MPVFWLRLIIRCDSGHQAINQPHAQQHFGISTLASKNCQNLYLQPNTTCLSLCDSANVVSLLSILLRHREMQMSAGVPWDGCDFDVCCHPYYICARDAVEVSKLATGVLQLAGFLASTSPRILQQDGSAAAKR